MWPPPTKLPALLERAKSGAVSPGWLYLPEEPQAWGSETDAYVIDGDEEDREVEAQDRGYCSTVDHQTLVDIIRATHEILHVDSFVGRLEALKYYYRFDAFLPRLGAPDPPPPEEILMRLDRKFYESLGSERVGVACREPECGRGAIALSVFCKVHHFQQLRHRPCPFAD